MKVLSIGWVAITENILGLWLQPQIMKISMIAVADITENDLVFLGQIFIFIFLSSNLKKK